MSTHKNISTPTPLKFGPALLLFAVPAAAIYLSFHHLIPALQQLGISPLESYLTAHILPMALLFAASIVAYAKVEGNPMNMRAFGERFRLKKLTFRAFAISIGLFILLNLGYGLFSQIGAMLIENGTIPLPENLPLIADPRVGFTSEALSQMAGEPIAGNWGIAALYLVMLVFNIIGEEFWWRGYILPRQELAHGRWTWVIHGLMWTGFHFFKWWDLIGLLPVTLLIAYFAQRTKNNTITIIAHFLFNGLGFAIVLASVLGFM